MRFTIYNNSIGATFLDLFGSGLVLGGVVMFIGSITEGEIGAIICSIIFLLWGIGMKILAEAVASNKTKGQREKEEFMKWVQYMEAQGWTQMVIASSRDNAVRFYNFRPGDMTLNYVKQINPQAGTYIENYQKQYMANRR